MLAYADIKLAMANFVFDSGGMFGGQRIMFKLRDGSTQKLSLRQSNCMRKPGYKMLFVP